MAGKPTIPSNASASSPTQQCGKLYAALYYVRHSKHSGNEDHAFGAAASTFLRKMKTNRYAGYTTKLKYCKGDVMLRLAYSDEASFRAGWKKIHAMSQTKPAYGIGIFAHHTITGGKSMMPGWNPSKDKDSWDLDASEVAKLPKPKWIPKKSFIFFAACNADDGGSNIARQFYKSQGVQVISSRAFAYFSRNSKHYESIDDGTNSKGKVTGEVYLLGFKRPRNVLDPDTYTTPGGYGARIPEDNHE